MVLQMNNPEYKITFTTDGTHIVEFFPYNEDKLEDCAEDWRITRIKSQTDTLMPANHVRVFAPDDIEIMEVNEYGIFLKHKKKEENNNK